MKKINYLFILLTFLLVSTSFSAQVEIVSTDTPNQAWAKETLNNADLQNNIDTPVDHVVSVTGDLSLLSGYATGTLYTGDLADGASSVITIANWPTSGTGAYATFIKVSGSNSTLRVISVDATFDEAILENNTGFTISSTTTGYTIKQDSRPDPSNITINFFPTTNVSEIEPGYAGVVETENPEAETVVTAPAITSGDPANPTFLGYFINDDKALVGIISARNINGLGNLSLTSAFNRYAKIRFEYYEYDYGTTTLNTTALSTTAYSGLIQSTSPAQFFIGGSLPDNTWAETSIAGNLIVMGLFGYKTDLSGNPSVTGDNPTIDFISGGATPSKTTIDVPVNAVNHATLGGVSTAGTSVPDGHIDSNYPFQTPELTTTERDAVASPKNGMRIFNTTTQVFNEYLASAWGIVLSGGDVTEAGDNTYSGTNTFNGATALNRLGGLILSDGTDNMVADAFAFAAARTLLVGDYDTQWPADALLDDTTGLLAVNIVDEPQINFTNAPTDGYIPTYNAAGTNQTWVAFPVSIGVAASDESTALTTGTAEVTFRAPYAFTLTEVRANVNTAPTGAALNVDINESGTTVLSTNITIDVTELTSETAATPPVISDSAIADDAEITIDIDVVGSTIAGAGLKIWLIGTRTL